MPFLFANVGDDSENPATIQYLRDHALPYAAREGVELHELRRGSRDGQNPTLLERIHARERAIDIPVRMANGAPGNRNCTHEFKIKVVAKWLRGQGATAESPADVHLGITVDEHQRMADSRVEWIRNRYPLVDLRLDRQDCLNLVARAGLPEPPKSACWFCPYTTLPAWRRRLREEPALFAQAVQLERTLNIRRRKLGKDDVYLSSRMKPLDQAVKDDGQGDLFDACDTGHCWT